MENYEGEPINKMELFNTPATTLPSPADSRDFKVKETKNFWDIPDTLTVDSSYIEYVYQRKVGCCTKASLVKILEELQYKKTGVYIQYSVRFAYTILERFFDNENYKELEEAVNKEDIEALKKILSEPFAVNQEGSSMRNALKCMQKIGCVPESMYPSNFKLSYEEFVSGELTPELLLEAKKHKIGAYFRGINDKSAICAYIANYGMIYARFECGESWYTNTDGNVTWLPSLILPLRKPTKVESGHAVCLDGYDKKDNYKTWLLNSWSKGWADKGRGFYYPDSYEPTEVWIVTLDPIGTIGDKVQTVEADESTWRKFLSYLRSLGTGF